MNESKSVSEENIFQPKFVNVIEGAAGVGDVIGVPTEYLLIVQELELPVGAVMGLLFNNGDTLNDVTINEVSLSLRKVGEP
ncbi:hypothetical protein C4577_07555 [Candidatus Parcubacteria bacterium]|nr:MAG: hypothetical protein C4577_07555 [Candidatus Parcubacteria bacterium]